MSSGSVLEARESAEGAEARVHLDRRGWSLWLPGRFLEASVTHDAAEILFLTHGILNEEQLEICLVEDGRLSERLSLAFAGGADDVTDIVPVPGGVTFCFPASRGWRLEVLEAPRLMRPRSGVYRHNGLRGRLLLRPA